jgi:hypothetical protein
LKTTINTGTLGKLSTVNKEHAAILDFVKRQIGAVTEIKSDDRLKVVLTTIS